MFGALAALNPVAAIGSALSVGGDVLAYKGQQDTNEMNYDIAKENRVFQERMANSAQDYQDRANQKAMDFSRMMSNTSYRRGMRDMKAAGLNPILAYSQGGASTPIGQSGPGHSAVGSTAQMQNPAGVFSGSVGRMADVAQTAADVSLKGEQENAVYWQARQAASQVGLNQAQADLVAEEIQKKHEEIALVRANTDAVEADNVERQIMADFYESADFAAIARKLGVSPNMLGGLFKMFFGGKKR